MTGLRYSVTDECPSCHKLVAHMFQEYQKVINIGNLIICVRCGCVFLPKSQIKHILDASESRIINPNTVIGNLKLP